MTAQHAMRSLSRDGIHMRLAVIGSTHTRERRHRTTEDIVDGQDPNGFLEPDAVSELGLSILIDGRNRHGNALYKLGDTVDNVGCCKSTRDAVSTSQNHWKAVSRDTNLRDDVDDHRPRDVTLLVLETLPPPVL